MLDCKTLPSPTSHFSSLSIVSSYLVSIRNIEYKKGFIQYSQYSAAWAVSYIKDWCLCGGSHISAIHSQAPNIEVIKCPLTGRLEPTWNSHFLLAGGSGRHGACHGCRDITHANFISFGMIFNRPGVAGAHYASKHKVILIDQAAWILSYSKVTRKPPLLSELTSFGQRESAPAILDLY